MGRKEEMSGLGGKRRRDAASVEEEEEEEEGGETSDLYLASCDME